MSIIKNTALFLFFIMIIFSCADDESIDVFAKGSRELTIQFAEFGNTVDRFCLVTDDDGIIYWDSLYSENQSLSRIRIPIDKPVNITFGLVDQGQDRVDLETFYHVEDEFSFFFQTFEQSCFVSQVLLSLDEKQVVIHGVTAASEVIQSGLRGVDNQAYDGTSAQLSFWFSPLSLLFSDQTSSRFIVLRDRVSGKTNGLLAPDSIWNNTEIVNLNYEDFDDVVPHIIQFDRVGQWVYGLNMEDLEHLAVLQSFPAFPYAFPPSSNNLVYYLPGQSNLDVFRMNIQSVGFDFLGEGHSINFQSKMLPPSIELFNLELENRGTTNARMRYELSEPVDYIRSSIRFENSSFWTVHQLGGARTDIQRPPLSKAIQQSFPSLSESISEAIQLEVKAYKLEAPNMAPSMDSKFIGNAVKCMSHQAVCLSESL